jgi:hypothetical protein
VSSDGFIIIISNAGVEPIPPLLWTFIGLLYQPWMIDGDDCGAVSAMNEWWGKLKYLEETFFYLSMGLKWNQVHYYCDHLLAYCTSSG